MKDDAPKYIAPQPDPGLALLTQQNEQQRLAALQDRATSASAALMQRYGTRIALGPQNSTPIAPLLRGVGGADQGGASLFSIADAGGIM